MIQYDSKAGTHFVGKRISVSQHAQGEAVADFRVTPEEAERWVIDNLVKAQFIGTIYGENDRPIRLFGYKRIAFVLATEQDVVITLYQRDKVDPTLREPLEQIVRTAVQNANDRLKSAELTYHKTVSGLQDLKPNADEDSFYIIEKLINQAEKDIAKERQAHARVMKGIVAYV